MKNANELLAHAAFAKRYMAQKAFTQDAARMAKHGVRVLAMHFWTSKAFVIIFWLL